MFSSPLELQLLAFWPRWLRWWQPSCSSTCRPRGVKTCRLKNGLLLNHELMKDWLFIMCTPPPHNNMILLFRLSKLWWVMQNAFDDKISLKKGQCLAESIGDAQWIDMDYIHMMTLGPWVLLVWLKIIEPVHMFHSEIPSSSRTIWSLLRPLAEVNWATSRRLTWRLRFSKRHLFKW